MIYPFITITPSFTLIRSGMYFYSLRTKMIRQKVMVLIPASSLQLQLLNQGPENPLCWVLVLSTAAYLQLTRTSCAPSYIIFLRPLNSTCRQSRLPSTGCTCYLHRWISYFDSSAGVNMQHLRASGSRNTMFAMILQFHSK